MMLVLRMHLLRLRIKTIKVVIDKKEASSSDANSIIKTVMEKTKK